MKQTIQVAALVVVVSTACVPVPVEEPVEAPELTFRTLEGATRYQVVPEGTLVYARVFRGGRLARLGHNHVVLFSEVRGDIYLADEFHESLFDLAVSPDRSVVDPAGLRQAQGEDFQTRVSNSARESTRQNMLGSDVLDAENYPLVAIRSTEVSGSLDSPRVTVEISLKGAVRRLTMPLSLDVGGNRLTAMGKFKIVQSEFGIQPYSVFGGALRVEDQVEIEFTVAAVKS